MLARGLQLALAPERLGDAKLHFRMGLVQVERGSYDGRLLLPEDARPGRGPSGSAGFASPRRSGARASWRPRASITWSACGRIRATPRTLLDLGDLLMEMGRVEEAGEKFRRAIELAPEEPAGYFCHGVWLMRHLSAERDEQAIAAFTKVLQLGPDVPGAHLRLGEVHHRRRECSMPASTSRQSWCFARRTRTCCWTCPTCWSTPARPAAVACLKRLCAFGAGQRGRLAEPGRRPVHGRPLPGGDHSCHEAIARDADNVMALYNLALAYEHWAATTMRWFGCAKVLAKAPRTFRSRSWNCACAVAELGRNG